MVDEDYFTEWQQPRPDRQLRSEAFRLSHSEIAGAVSNV